MAVTWQKGHPDAPDAKAATVAAWPAVHGCHNRAPFKPAMLVQDGWEWSTFMLPGGGEQRRTRVPRMVSVPFRMSADCRYAPPEGVEDKGCDGCRWKAHT